MSLMHALRGHDIQRTPKTANDTPISRVLDVAYNERDRSWQLLVVDLETGELESVTILGRSDLRIVPFDSGRAWRTVPHRHQLSEGRP